MSLNINIGGPQFGNQFGPQGPMQGRGMGGPRQMMMMMMQMMMQMMQMMQGQMGRQQGGCGCGGCGGGFQPMHAGCQRCQGFGF